MTRVELILRPGVRCPLSAAQCRAVLEAAIDAAGAPPNATVSLILSDDAELAELNVAHMGKTGPTDVLSFPLLPPSAFPQHWGQDPRLRLAGAPAADFRLPPHEPVHLGDVVVSVERAVEQAESGSGGQTGNVRWSASQELRLLITHGGLHLCGWDHTEPEEEAAMRALEAELLGAGGPPA